MRVHSHHFCSSPRACKRRASFARVSSVTGCSQLQLAQRPLAPFLQLGLRPRHELTAHGALARPRVVTVSGTGSNERPYFRVATPTSICSTARFSSGSSRTNASYVGSRTSPPSTRRTRGRRTDTRRPPRTSSPWVSARSRVLRTSRPRLTGSGEAIHRIAGQRDRTRRRQFDQLPRAPMRTGPHLDCHHRARRGRFTRIIGDQGTRGPGLAVMVREVEQDVVGVSDSLKPRGSGPVVA